MKKLVDLFIIAIILLIILSFYLKGWGAVACALVAAVFAALAFFLNKKN